MSETNMNDQERYAALAEWAESDAALDGMQNATVIRGEGEAPGRELLAAALGSEDAVDKAIGRPSLSKGRPAGESPVRHVRLPADLDALLTARAEREHVKRSVVIREALDTYLRSA